MVLISAKHSCASESKPTTNHVIKFIGMGNGYNSTSIASEALASNLKAVTNSAGITIDSLDENGASWYNDELGYIKDRCPEAEIRSLVETILNSSSTEYTRKFKMYITEHFTMPKTVSIDWLGVCENVVRKRSQIEPAASSTSTASSESVEIEPLTTEPEAPTTTTEVPLTTPSATETTLNSTIKDDSDDLSATELEFDSDLSNMSLISSLDSSFPSFGSSELSNLAIETTTLLATTTTTDKVEATMTTTTTTSSPSTVEMVTSTDSTTTTALTETLTDQTNAAETTSTETIVIEDSPGPVDREEVSTTGTNIITDEPELSSSRQALPYTTMDPGSLISTSGSPSEEAAFGKYIGLTAGFLIFVAYLICSRAYRRQGMYELQN